MSEIKQAAKRWLKDNDLTESDLKPRRFGEMILFSEAPAYMQALDSEASMFEVFSDVVKGATIGSHYDE